MVWASNSTFSGWVWRWSPEENVRHAASLQCNTGGWWDVHLCHTQSFTEHQQQEQSSQADCAGWVHAHVCTVLPHTVYPEWVVVSVCLAGVPRRLELIQGPDNITVAMGTAISMHCAVRGFPVPMVHWFKNGCHLTNSSASFSLQNNGQLLTFRFNTARDQRNINALLLYCENNYLKSIIQYSAFMIFYSGHKGRSTYKSESTNLNGNSYS